MNAQAEQLKDLVDELVILINGRGKEVRSLNHESVTTQETGALEAPAKLIACQKVSAVRDFSKDAFFPYP